MPTYWIDGRSMTVPDKQVQREFHTEGGVRAIMHVSLTDGVVKTWYQYPRNEDPSTDFEVSEDTPTERDPRDLRRNAKRFLEELRYEEWCIAIIDCLDELEV
jgi:hypothetical protein